MIVKLDTGGRARLIGDPHLGKSFETGVPLDRRGEREKRQLEKFNDLLNTPDVEYVVVMGDLFDHPYVGYSVVLDTYKALVNAAASNRKTQFIVLAGNHDLPRNLQSVGAFQMLERMCHMRVDNLNVVDSPSQIGHIAVFPWQWAIAAVDQQILAPIADRPVELVVGHWDMMTYGENDSHLAPTKMLRATFGNVPLYSGHYHVAGEYEIDGHVVTCTGSMEPYSHGEDPSGEIYVTLSLSQLEKIPPSELRDKCVRVLLEEGEEMPTGLDCLSLTPKRVSAEMDAIDIGQLVTFNWNNILDKKLEGLDPEVKGFIKERLTDG